MRHGVENNEEVFLTLFFRSLQLKRHQELSLEYMPHWRDDMNVLVFTLEVDWQTLPGHSI